MTARKRKSRAVRCDVRAWNGKLILGLVDLSATGCEDRDYVMVVPRAEWLRLKRIEKAAAGVARSLGGRDTDEAIRRLINEWAKP